MTTPSRIATIGYAVEAAHAEADRDIDVLIQHRGEVVDVTGLAQEMLDPGGVYQRLGERGKAIPGVRGGTFTTRHHLYGHGITAAGDLTATPIATLLQYVFGALDVANDGGICAAGWTAVTGDVTSVDTLADGSLVRIGAPGDGRGGGQFFRATHSGGTVTLQTAAPAAPAENDVIYAAQLLYPPTVTTPYDVTTLRWLLATSSAQFWALGCAATAITITGLHSGAIPTVEITWTVSDWDDADETFPVTSPSIADYNAVPAGPGGSLFYQAAGTATRATLAAREIALRYEMDVVPLRGVGGNTGTESIYGFRRADVRCMVDVTVDAVDATTSPVHGDYFATDPDAITLKHALLTCSNGDGNAIGFYWPQLQPTGRRPTQDVLNGLTVERLPFMAVPNSAGASELERALMVLAMG